MIQSVEKIYKGSIFTNHYKVTFEDGTISFVPHNEKNRHYIEIQEWISEGNTVIDNPPE